MADGRWRREAGSREETPVDVNSRSGPRVVFPPLNQNANPPPAASVSPSAPMPAGTGNGTMPNNEPRRIKTLAVKGDAGRQRRRCRSGASAPPPRPAPPTRNAAAPAAAAPTREPAVIGQCQRQCAAVACAAGRPSRSRRPAWPRVTPTNPRRPRFRAVAADILVQVTSQKNEADAQASFRALQGKYPSVLGSRSPVIKRADLGDKGVYYRAMVGPFGSAEEAVAVLRQPEDCRRTVRRPKELTAVSLTPGRRAG